MRRKIVEKNKRERNTTERNTRRRVFIIEKKKEDTTTIIILVYCYCIGLEPFVYCIMPCSMPEPSCVGLYSSIQVGTKWAMQKQEV